MVDPLLGAAIGNNAEWRDAVCQSHGISGVFSERLWSSEARTPPYYPNIITLTPNAGQGRELRAAAERIRASVGADISIKDSFADADLADVGMRILFGATWIGRDATIAPPHALIDDLAWSIAKHSSELDEWKSAWDGEIIKTDPVFAPSLLEDPNIAFMAARREGQLIAGAIANRHAGVVGLSNVFGPAIEAATFWRGFLAMATRWAPGLALVGYESGADLSIATELGFRPLCPLRVWVAG